MSNRVADRIRPNNANPEGHRTIGKTRVRKDKKKGDQFVAKMCAQAVGVGGGRDGILVLDRTVV
jgi:hypothetical protein